MFNRSKARVALLVDLQEELIRKIDEQIRVEREFINRLDSFFMFEKKMELERLRYDLVDKKEKDATKDDLRY